MATTTNSLTFEEFERLPEEHCKVELLEGEVIHRPPAKTRHARIALQLATMLKALLAVLHNQSDARDLGEVFVEAGYRIGPHWLIPDVSISHARQSENEYLLGGPALAVEVISDANTAEMMQQRVRRYVDGGTREVWLLYPRTGTVAVHRGRTSVEVDGTLSSELLPGVSIDLAEVFGVKA